MRWLLYFFLVLLAGCDKPKTPGFGVCGDGVLGAGEECDNGPDNNWFAPDACRPDCTRARCGDGIKDSGEECDRAQTGGLSCSDLGFDKGILQCNDNCTFDTRLCSRCGNGVAETGESCDLGDLGGLTCAGAGFSGGGEVSCRLDCEYDFSRCIDGCGNGVIEGSEACDTDNVLQPDCRTWGFESGQVRCSSSCRLDFSLCAGGCGNGRLEPGETCDDGNFDPLDGCVNCRAPSGRFELLSTVELPYLAADVDIADVDGDGLPDLVAAFLSEDASTGALVWTSGAKNHAVPHVLAAGPFLFARAVQRFQTTGILGVSLAGVGASTFVWLDAWNAPPVETMLSDRPLSFLVADMDGDGAQDILFSAFAAQNVGVFFPEAGSFSGINVQGGMPQAIGRIDYSRDGLFDLVVTRGASQMLSMLRRVSGEWVYESARYLGGRPGELAVADVDGDGVDDVLVVDLSAPKLYALKGDAGSLTTRVELALPSAAYGIAAGRLDADAHVDVALSLPAEKAVSVFSGSGEWSFARIFTYTPCETPERVRVADMDGDGFLDLVFTCRQDGKIVILHSIPQ